jgi:hypothetical protein
MILRNEQFAALASQWERSKRASFAARIRREFPAQVADQSDEELAKDVEDGCAAARMLEIDEAEQVYRFLRLRYAPPALWERPGLHDVLFRTLMDRSLDPADRLQFVETNLFGAA